MGDVKNNFYKYENGWGEMSMDGYFSRGRFVDLDGRLVEKTPFSNPYDFDEYVEWKGDYSKADAADYSDRLFSWDSKKYEECRKKVFNDESQKFDAKNPNKIEEFLCLYFGEKVELTAIVRGCNVSSGFPYWVFFYRYVK